MIASFSVSPSPHIIFGDGALAKVPASVLQFGRNILLVTGSSSFQNSTYWIPLTRALQEHGATWKQIRVEREPSPEFIDQTVQAFTGRGIDVVLGIGGGSVLDAAKAIAGLLPHGNSVMDHLEGVGPENPYEGPATPFIAVPTTAGTGSEATKNAVLSMHGANGFKKSFRHDLLVPRLAIVDPLLLASCTRKQIAANGMDALTQLLESYVSSRANRYSDALAWSGLVAAQHGLFEWYDHGPNESAARANMAYAALLSGITLAQVGLGSVHGLASPLGAYFPIPHGEVCGTLVAAATETNIRALTERAADSPALEKYAEAGRLLGNNPLLSSETACELLVQTLRAWTERMQLPRLRVYGVTESHLPRIVANCRGSSMKTNPVVLTDDEIMNVLLDRL